MKKQRTVTEVKDALVAVAIKRGKLADASADYIAGVTDTLAWINGEPGRTIGGVIGETDTPAE